MPEQPICCEAYFADILHTLCCQALRRHILTHFPRNGLVVCKRPAAHPETVALFCDTILHTCAHKSYAPASTQHTQDTLHPCTCTHARNNAPTCKHSAHVRRLLGLRANRLHMKDCASGGSLPAYLRSRVSGRDMSGNFRPANLQEEVCTRSEVGGLQEGQGKGTKERKRTEGIKERTDHSREALNQGPSFRCFTSGVAWWECFTRAQLQGFHSRLLGGSVLDWKKLCFATHQSSIVHS
eukprot:276784-Pelagomonas_calceolata.AAC.1